MNAQLLPATPQLLRELERSYQHAPVLSLYARANYQPNELRDQLTTIAAAVFPHAGGMSLVSAVLDHVYCAMDEMTRTLDKDVRGVACFAEVGGSVVDDVWVWLPIALPMQAYLSCGAALVPLAVAIERSEPAVQLPDPLASLLPSSVKQ